MSNDVVDAVGRAVELAAGLGWFNDYNRWAGNRLDGTDRSAGSARIVFHQVRQWVDFFGANWTPICCRDAARAAWALALENHREAARSAEAAIRHAGFAKNPPPPPPGPGAEPELVFDDWNYDSDGRQRGRSYDPREV